MDKFNPPSELSLEGNLAENWRKWSQRFKLYLTASGAVDKPEVTQVAILLHCVGSDALEVFNTFVFVNPNDSDKLEIVESKFKAYCNPRKNTVFERYKFWERNQMDGESIDQFVTDLKMRAKSCEFGDQHDSLIRDRIVFGVKNIRLKERLLRDSPDLSMTKAVEICRASEASMNQVKTIQSHDATVHAINKQQSNASKPKQRYKGKHVNTKQPTSNSNASCRRCGNKHPPRACPAYGVVCHKCKGKNHFAKMCMTKKTYDMNTIDETQSYEKQNASDDELYIGTISLCVGDVNKPNETNESWFSNIQVQNVKLKVKLDTGAQTNVIPQSVYNKLNPKPKLLETDTVLSAYGGSNVPHIGKILAECKTGTSAKSSMFEFYVVKGTVSPILGLSTCKELNLVKKIESLTSNLITKQQLVDEYSDVFTGIGTLEGTYHIELKEDIIPTIHPPRRVPHTLHAKLQETLKKLETSGVVAKVDKPTDWVNSLVIVEKKNGSLRLCLDPKELNKAIKREHHQIPTSEDITSKLSGKSVFTILDEKDGYWQVKLDESSSYLCTFNTPFGRYRFLRMPFGICSASEVFQKRNEATFGDIEGVRMISDDLIVAGKDENEHDKILQQVMTRAREKNVKFNKSKIQLRVPEVKYMGNVISAQGLKPDEDRVLAIAGMPQPQNRHDIRRFLGMLNYVAQFIPNMSTITAPLRDLLKLDSPWSWNHEHDRAYEHLKNILMSKPVLAFYDVTKSVTIQADASQYGLGACLIQEGHPIAYASRSLTSAEENYAQIEKELLAIVFACEKFHHYVYGKPINVQSDHKPLESILKKSLQKATPRLQLMLLRLMKYHVNVSYLPGKLMFIADTLSRATMGPNKEDVDATSDIEVRVHSIVENLPITSRKQEELKQLTATDETLQDLKVVMKDGWPHHKAAVKLNLRQFWNSRNELHEAEGLIFLGDKLVIPTEMRSEMLKTIHEGHMGIEKCKSRARKVIYWPGMSSDIEDSISKCSICNKHKNRNQKEPLLPHPLPERPWQKVATDLFQYKTHDYLVVVDYYSKFPEIIILPDKTSKSVITSLKSIFSRHGIPEELCCDNMPFASSEMNKFAIDWDIKITTSSPTYPQSNGMSERAVQTVKQILRKADDDGQDPYIALLNYRNSPVSGLRYSPSELLMSRLLRSKLPSTNQHLEPKLPSNARQSLEVRQHKQSKYYDRHSKQLPKINVGDSVRIAKNNVWEPAVVTEKHAAPRSYIVTTPEAQSYRRNRRHLLKTSEPAPTISGPPIDELPDNTTPCERSIILPRDENPEPDTNIIRTSSGRIVRPPARFRDYQC